MSSGCEAGPSSGTGRLRRADRAFPVVDIVYTVAVGHAAAGEAHEARVDVGEFLGEVGTETVLASAECLRREERHHVDVGFGALYVFHESPFTLIVFVARVLPLLSVRLTRILQGAGAEAMSEKR